MIGFLKGIVELKDDPYVFVNVSGVGYKVYVSSEILSKIATSDPITLFIHTHVREDSLDLYGFSTPLDLKLFEMLIGVSGIGPKTAVGIFAVGNRGSIVDAITKGDASFFEGIPRLGRKNAQKIIIELRNKLGGGELGDISLTDGQGSSDVLEALQSFGYSLKEAREVVRKLDGKGETVEEKIKLALKQLGK